MLDAQTAVHLPDTEQIGGSPVEPDDLAIGVEDYAGVRKRRTRFAELLDHPAQPFLALAMAAAQTVNPCVYLTPDAESGAREFALAQTQPAFQPVNVEEMPGQHSRQGGQQPKLQATECETRCDSHRDQHQQPACSQDPGSGHQFSSLEWRTGNRHRGPSARSDRNGRAPAPCAGDGYGRRPSFLPRIRCRPRPGPEAGCGCRRARDGS